MTPKAQLDLPLTQEKMVAALRQAFARFQRPFADSPADVRLAGLGLTEARGAELGVLMRPIATPLVLVVLASGLRARLRRAGRPRPDRAARRRSAPATPSASTW